MKKDEYFRFDSLIEAPLEEKKEDKIDAKTISQKIAFVHRITNLEEVERFEKEKYLNLGLTGRIMFYIGIVFVYSYFIVTVFIKPAFIDPKSSFNAFSEKLAPYVALAMGIFVTIFYIVTEIRLKKRNRLFRLVNIIK